MPDLDINRMSRYPFLKISREYVSRMNLTMKDMLSPDNSIIQKKALARIEAAIEGRSEEGAMRASRSEVESDLLSYPVSRFLVAAVGDKNLIKWFSHNEGKKAKEYLEREDMSLVRKIGRELDMEVLTPPITGEGDSSRRFMDVRKTIHRERTSSEQGIVWLSFTDFLKAKRNISGSSWDLINQRLVKGKVGVETNIYIRLVQERIKIRVEEGLERKTPLPENRELREMISGLKSKVESRRKDFSPTDLGKMSITRLPPCMRQILGMSQAGENMPHHARFALVTFLNAIGMNRKDIFGVFTSAPDFKEDIVRYQVDHITGGSSATNYHAPNCQTMKSGGICFNPDGLCEKEWMNSPLYYYKLKGKKKKGTTSENNVS